VNPQARCLRYSGSARFQRAGSGGILPPVHHFQTGSEVASICFGDIFLKNSVPFSVRRTFIGE
jgi:hypothetical protein